MEQVIGHMLTGKQFYPSVTVRGGWLLSLPSTEHLPTLLPMLALALKVNYYLMTEPQSISLVSSHS